MLCVLACLWFWNADAQSCSISIKLSVVETHNFEPVYPALVHIEPIDTSLETDETGTVQLRKLCAGTYVVRVVAAGYTPQVDTLRITGDKTYRIKVSLAEHELSEVSIKDERRHTIRQVREQMDEAALKAASGKGLADMLQAVNGVSVLSNGATIAKPVIHGMHSNRIVMVNNGVKQEDQQWGGEHAPNIDPAIAGKITVVKGAAGVRYGTDAIGGVVLVEPSPLRNKAGWDGSIDMSAFSNNRMGVVSGMVQHNFTSVPALAFRVQGSYKQGGNYRIPGHWVANTGVTEADLSSTVAYRKLHYGGEVYYSHFSTDLGVYRGSHTGNQADLENAINSPVPLVASGFTYSLDRPRQHVTHDLAKASAYADTRMGMWHVDYGFQRNFRQEYDVLRKENGKAQLNLTLNTHMLNAHLDHKPVLGLEGQLGIDGTYQTNYFRDGDRLFIPLYSAAGAGTYLIERLKRDKWDIEAGLRYDYKWYGVKNPEGNDQHLVYYSFNYSNASGTVGFHKQQSDRFDWQVILGNAWRAPQASELFSAGLHHGAARVELGNKYLRPERAYSLNGEAKYAAGKSVLFDLSIYSQLINDFIYLQPGANLLTIRGYFKTFNYTQTNAWLNGADFAATANITDRLTTTLKASILRALDRSKNDWLILMPADRFNAEVRYTVSLSPTVKDFYVEANARYVFRQSRIPSNFDQIDHPRPPVDYFLAGAGTGCIIKTGKQTFRVSATVTNLFNVKYRDYLDVFRYFIDQPGTNVVLRIGVPINQS